VPRYKKAAEGQYDIGECHKNRGMSADVRDVGKGGDPRKNGKDQRDEKHDLFWRFQSRHVAPRKKTWSRTPKRIVLATRCQVGADASAALAGGYIRRSSAISMLGSLRTMKKFQTRECRVGAAPIRRTTTGTSLNDHSWNGKP